MPDAHLHVTDLAALLTRLAAQLHEAYGLGRHVEDSIATLIRETAGQRPASRPSFQQLDILVQSLESLSIYVDTLAGAIPEGTNVDAREATQRVKLRALSQALTARELSGGEAEASDLHLF